MTTVLKLLLIMSLARSITHTKFLRASSEDSITIAIIGTNDLHGEAFPQEILNTRTQETYKMGGIVYLARLIQILQE